MLEEDCKYDEALKYNVEVLDKYDFSEFLTEDRSLYNLCDELEELYDKDCKEKYHIYLFDDIGNDDLIAYFASRYNIWFQEYTDWVIKHDEGKYVTTRKREQYATNS